MNSTSLTLQMAWRYLRANKSHSAVSTIARVSVAGVAVATAAIVCVLSVFNGFQDVLGDKLDRMSADAVVEPVAGKTFANGDSLAAVARSLPEVALALPAVSDNALALAASCEMPVRLIGVDPALYRKITSLDSIMLEGGRVPAPGSKEIAASVGVASQLGLYENGADLLLFAPRRKGRVNLANPITSFITDSVNMAGVYRADQSEYDANTVVCDIEVARTLFQYTHEATSLLVKGHEGVSPSVLAEALRSGLGNQVRVKDRLQQQEMNFRMIKIEKWVTFLLLFFILVIASFNIISTLSMLVLEKQKQMKTLCAIGMSRRMIGGVFWWESVIVTLVGGISGLAIGVALSLLQQHCGFIKIAGDTSTMILDHYPVVVEASDVAISFIPVALIGLCAAWVSSSFAKSRCTT